MLSCLLLFCFFVWLVAWYLFSVCFSWLVIAFVVACVLVFDFLLLLCCVRLLFCYCSRLHCVFIGCLVFLVILVVLLSLFVVLALLVFVLCFLLVLLVLLLLCLVVGLCVYCFGVVCLVLSWVSCVFS